MTDILRERKSYLESNQEEPDAIICRQEQYLFKKRIILETFDTVTYYRSLSTEKPGSTKPIRVSDSRMSGSPHAVLTPFTRRKEIYDLCKNKPACVEYDKEFLLQTQATANGDLITLLQIIWHVTGVARLRLLTDDDITRLCETDSEKVWIFLS